ncbi:DUF4185 domain-containing protein [Curtobacterium flaccumfaciens]|nr:DUF4185 domain-containing protein [Curtobacterium flaccumfaciens]
MRRVPGLVAHRHSTRSSDNDAVATCSPDGRSHRRDPGPAHRITGLRCRLRPTPTPVGGPASRASTPAANGGLTVKDFDVLGPLDQNSHVAARDNGQSILYQGKSYWFFDDTIETDPDDFLTSTAAVTSDLNASDNIALHSTTFASEADTGAPTEFVPVTPTEQAFQDAHASADCTGSTDPNCGTVFGFWPGSAVADPVRHRILVFEGKLCRGGPDTGPCASGFIGQQIGSGIVSIDMRTKTATRMLVQHQDPALSSPEGADGRSSSARARSGATAAPCSSGTKLYAYGGCDDDHACGVARVPISRVNDRAAWSFYTGTVDGRARWSSDETKAVTDMQGGAAGETVQYDATTHQYMNTFEPALSDQVQFQTAPTPWGPWSTPTDLFTAQKSTAVNYAAFAHPEYTTNHGMTRYYTYYSSETGAQMLVKVDFTLPHRRG